MDEVVVPKEVVTELVRIAEEPYNHKTAFHKGYQSAIRDFLFRMEVTFKDQE